MQLLICLAHHVVGISSFKGAAGSLFLKPPLVTPSEQHYVGTFIALFISDIMDIDYVSTFSQNCQAHVDSDGSTEFAAVKEVNLGRLTSHALFRPLMPLSALGPLCSIKSRFCASKT